MNTVGDGAETPHIASVCGSKPPAAFSPRIDDWFAEENHRQIATGENGGSDAANAAIPFSVMRAPREKPPSSIVGSYDAPEVAG